MDNDEIIRRSQAACDALSADDDGLKREVLSHAGNRWSLGIVHVLGVSGRLRHAEIGRRMTGVTQRMLTRTLRQLERDGLAMTFRKCRQGSNTRCRPSARSCWCT